MNKLIGGSVAIKQALVYLVLLLGSVVFVFPFVWTVLSSLKDANEAIAIPPVWLPKIWQWRNYVELFTLLPFASFYLNTVLLVFFRIVCAVLFSTMAAYGFAKISFPGQQIFLCAGYLPIYDTSSGIYLSAISHVIPFECLKYAVRFSISGFG